MTVVAVVAALGCLLLVVLAYAVGRLQGEVRRLSSELAASPSEPVDEPEAALVPVAPVPAADRVEVPVITALPQAAELDLSMSRVVSVTLARPLIRVVALSYGLRHALDDERRFRIRYAMHQEFKRQRRMRRRRRAGWGPSDRRRG
jgi:hypothetical protein